MLQFNNNHIFTGYLKQFLSSFNLPTCKVYTAEFERYFLEHGKEDPRIIESNLPIKISGTAARVRAATGINYLKGDHIQQYFWDTSTWNTSLDFCENGRPIKNWKTNQVVHYTGNKILGLTKTLKNPTTLYNYQTHEYLGDYLRFLRDYENINLMSMYNCFSNRLCNNAKITVEWKNAKQELRSFTANSYDTNYKIYMLPAKLFEKYTIAIDSYQGVELFCGLYDEKLNTSDKAADLIKRTYVRVPKALFNQPFIYDKLDVKYWNWQAENELNAAGISTLADATKCLRSELAMQEDNLKLFIKIPATNSSSIVVLAGDYRNYNDSIYTIKNISQNGQTAAAWQYARNTTITNFENSKTDKNSSLPELNSREFKPISRLQLLAFNTGISYPFADRLIEYLVCNVIVPNDLTPDNIRRLQKVMEDSGYRFQIDGVWEPKMQMILYDYLMNCGKFTTTTVDVLDKAGNKVFDEKGNEKQIVTDKVTDQRLGNLRQRGQGLPLDFYDILGYVDKDAEKLYASWKIETNEKTGKKQVVAKTTLENVDIYSNLYNNK